MPRSFADFLDSMMIALEADDITQQHRMTQGLPWVVDL